MSSTAADAAFVRTLFETADAEQSLNAMDAFTAADYRGHFPGMPPLDRDTMKQIGNAFYDACPGLRHDVHEVVCEGELCAARLEISGTHTRPLQTPSGAIAPQNRSFRFTSLNLYRVVDGKLAEHWISFDMLGFLQQIGAVPAPDEARVQV